MSNLLKKLGALRKKATPRTIMGTEFNFYPVRIARVVSGEMKTLIEPITRAASVLFDNSANDVQITEEVTPDGTVARQHNAISPELAQFRSKRRDKAINDAMSILLRDETRYALGRLIMDSLRDDHPNKNPSEEEVAEFVDADQMDIPVFIEFIKGFLNANTAMFGDLGNSIREIVKQKTEEILQAQRSPNSGAPQVDELTKAEAALEDEGSTIPQS
jgi:hypothetical protein